MRHLLRPAPVHYASLVVGAVVLLALGRDQWFAYDDWAVLHATTTPADWLGAHQGHWNTAAALAFQAVRAVVGMHSYLPFLALAVIAHLAVVHLLWRVLSRVGVAPWAATGLAGMTILLGCAAENLMWAFQFGFMGAIALGLLTVLLVDRQELGPAGVTGVIAVSVVALTFSGTALPLLAAAFALSAIRRGWVRSILLLAPAGAVYLVWYLLFVAGSPSPLAPHGFDIVTHVPLFFAVMFGAAYGQLVGLVPLGVPIALVLAVWVIRRFRSWTGPQAPAFALLLGSVVFAVLTAVSRSGGELTAAGAQRYVYVMVVLAIPVMGLALGELQRRGRGARLAVAAALVVVGAVNVTLLVVRAGEQAQVEQRVEREVSAALDLIAAEPGIDGGLRPVPDVAPDLTVAELRQQSGLFTRVPYSPHDEDQVREALGR